MNTPRHLLYAFRKQIEAADPISALRKGIIGKGCMIDGPFGQKPLLYADYVASGRALRQIETFILDEVLPYYANSHTEASYCGAFITGLRRESRAVIAELCGADDRHDVIFAGSGATAGLNRLVHLLGVSQAVRDGRGATVLIGPYEHHSNILPWRESGAEVVEIPEAAEGGPDLSVLSDRLKAVQGLVVGSFSAASNVSGIVTDVTAVTRMLKAAGALAVWDYAGGGPYLPIAMDPAKDAPIDALVLSPHKFIGGPGASGIFIVRKDAIRTSVPTSPGGGTVRFVSSTFHDYSLDIADREEAGTPNSVGDIRAALAMIVKDVVGQERIDAINADLSRRMLKEMAGMARIRLLGKTDCLRLPIFSFLIEDGPNGPVEPQFATRLLSDRFGIQMRGGCACAGPYGHHLLGIDEARSAGLRALILSGDLTGKPGFVRFNLSYLSTEEEFDTIVDALRALPGLADRQLGQRGTIPGGWPAAGFSDTRLS